MRQIKISLSARLFLNGLFSVVLVLSSIEYAAAAGFQPPAPISNRQKAHLDISFTGGGGNTVSEDGSCTSSGDDSILTGNDNQEKTYNFLTNSARGLSPTQAAAVMGNLMQESSFIPDNPKGGFGTASHWGLAQWDSTRQAALQTYAGSKDVTDLGVQLGYMWKEATENINGFDLATFKSKTTVPEATKYWLDTFEGAPGQAEAERIAFAEGFFTKYGGTPVVGDMCGGVNTQYIDGFTVYSQYDPAWVNKAYGSSTIGESGCGPAAMAMIITALLGKKVTPVQTANYAASKGLLVDGGSSWDIGPVLAEHWGLRSEFVGPSVTKINQALTSGGLVIVVGSGSEPFTSGGHFIVIRALTTDGKWLVGDSAHDDTNTKEWDPNVLVSQMREGGEYAIYK